MHRLLDFITENGLTNLPLKGENFTWSNSHEVASRSRLDKLLLLANWEDKFPSLCQRRLPRLLSDHFWILLKGGNFQRGKRPLRFENVWLKEEENSCVPGGSLIISKVLLVTF